MLLYKSSVSNLCINRNIFYICNLSLYSFPHFYRLTSVSGAIDKALSFNHEDNWQSSNRPEKLHLCAIRNDLSYHNIAVSSHPFEKWGKEKWSHIKSEVQYFGKVVLIMYNLEFSERTRENKFSKDCICPLRVRYFWYIQISDYYIKSPICGFKKWYLTVKWRWRDSGDQ